MTQAPQFKISLTPGRNLASVIDGNILRRAAVVALVIGSALTLVNQSAAIFGDQPYEYLQLGLVYILPFVVVAISQALGARRAIIDVRRNGGNSQSEETLLATALAHGIPFRTLVVGMLAGSVNASISVTSNLLDGASASDIALVPLAQAYVLPLAFGLLSQTIAYRRAIQSIRPQGAAASVGQLA